MNELIIKHKDEFVMKLLHYFITVENYNPVIIYGSQNEIWLENLEAPYKIIRIKTGYIHNNEQFKFDIFKIKSIVGKLKFKTLSFNLNVLSIFLDLGDNVCLESIDNINCINLRHERDLGKASAIKEAFPAITKKLKFVESGIQLFTKITSDINKKSERDALRNEEVFKLKPPYITYLLMAISIIVFFAMYFFGNGSYDNLTLINFGALVGELVRGGAYYRLITPIFIHIGLLHLFFNMYALYIIGTQLESFYGHFKFLLIYLFSALCGSLLSITFSSNTISAGASGAIFGLLGSLLYFGYHYRIYLGNALQRQIIPIILLNLLIGFTFQHIDQAAHIGGLVGGFMIAIAVGVKYKSIKSEQINGIIGSLLMLLFLIYLAFFYVV